MYSYQETEGKRLQEALNTLRELMEPHIKQAVKDLMAAPLQIEYRDGKYEKVISKQEQAILDNLSFYKEIYMSQLGIEQHYLGTL